MSLPDFDEAKVAALIEARLATLSPAIATKPENMAYTPAPGVPYQTLSWVHNAPRDLVMGRTLTEYLGNLFISLMYPADSGAGAARARAKLIRDLFAPPQTLVHASGLQVHINETTIIRGGAVDGDRWRVSVIVPWRAYG